MPANSNLFARYNQFILYSISLGLLLFLLKWLQYRFIIFDHAFEIYAGSIAIIFTTLGIWLAQKLARPRIEKIVVEKQVFVTAPGNFTANTALIQELELSRRELEVLQLMAKGHSNEEIAREIFVSLSTVKSHNQNIFFKLDVKRRTQAVEKARRLQLIP